MGDFRVSWAKTYGNEGNYANNPKDPGGETYKGISRKNWLLWGGWSIIDNIKRANPGYTVSGLNRLLAANTTLQQMVINFYEDNFWNGLGANNIMDQQICNNLFDCAVNEGEGDGEKFLQEACNQVIDKTYAPYPKLVVDGKIGPQTIGTVNHLDAELVYDAINNIRHTAYVHIIAENPKMGIWLKIWVSRLIPYKKVS